MEKALPLIHIGYLINTYPRPSHSFIRREIAALERIGISVHRIAMRGEEGLSDPADLLEQQKTEYILKRGARHLLRNLLRQALISPRAVLSGLKLAWQRSRAGESSLMRQVVYLAEGAAVTASAKARGLSHIHAHFGTNSARVAAYSALLGGPDFSFTVHGPEEFDQPVALDLGGKLAQARFAVTVSNFGRSQLSRWADLPDWDKIRVIHCGIETAHWPAPAPMPETGPLRIVAIGRFAEQKGFGLLIRAFAAARLKTPTLHLSLVGDGPLRPEIEAIIQKYGMQDNVDLLGWQDQSGVRQALDQSHLLVVPSFAEGLPVVMMEAMASGRPCLATYIAGIPELLREGQDGWLVPAGSVDALSEAMIHIAKLDHAELTGMGLAARERVFSRHDVDESARRLAELFTRR